MNRIKTKSTGIVLRITAVLTAILFCAAVPAQTALTGHATNSLGSQGSVNNGDSEGGNEGAEDAGGDDAELNEIINENWLICLLAAELITVFTCRYSRNGGRIYGTENV